MALLEMWNLRSGISRFPKAVIPIKFERWLANQHITDAAENEPCENCGGAGTTIFWKDTGERVCRACDGTGTRLYLMYKAHVEQDLRRIETIYPPKSINAIFSPVDM